MLRHPRRDRKQARAPDRMTPVGELSATAVEFLSAGTRTGMLGFAAQDGRPLVVPVWFIVDKGDLVLNTAKGSAKGRALMRDPRVVLCVDDPPPPYGFVQVQGTSTLSEDPDELLDIATRTAARYIGLDRAEEFGRRNGVPGDPVARIRPTKVIPAFGLAEKPATYRSAGTGLAAPELAPVRR